MARVEGKFDAVVEEIKALLCDMAIQNNEMMRLMINKKGGVNSGSILDNYVEVPYEVEEFKEVKQTGSLGDYLKAFEVLLEKAQLSEEQALRCFLAGLEHELEIMVRMFHPKTLKEAYSLAKLQDAVKNGPAGHGQGKSFFNNNQGSSTSFQAVKSDTAVHGQGKGFFNNNQGSSASFQVVKPNLPLSQNVNMGVNISTTNHAFVKKPLNLTPKQMEDKRHKNQCFWCVFRLKKLMILVGNSVHCLCVMISLQLWNQWILERLNAAAQLLIHWSKSSLLMLLGRCSGDQENVPLFSLEDKGS